MTKATFSLLLLVSFNLFAQESKDYALKFNSENLKNSTQVTVAGVQVPLQVVTEIQKVCEKKNLSVEECNTLTETGCLEFVRVYEDKNIKTIDIPVTLEVDLHINEHKHYVHKEQKRYTYHYDIKVRNTQSESHEYVELPPVHQAPTYSQTPVVQQPVQEKPQKAYTYKKQQNPSLPVHGQTPNQVQSSGTMSLPSNLRLSQEIARFVQENRIQCQVFNNGQAIRFVGVDAKKLSLIVFKHFPSMRRFDLAKNSQVVELFEDLKRNFL